ncbi:hypothetical protein HMPREF1249_0862 [Jonquetella sp. BV3C21]|nr:hypothetical protein HMPREF1249_0862 [Jonquetella sp. BV3C21]
MGKEDETEWNGAFAPWTNGAALEDRLKMSFKLNGGSV